MAGSINKVQILGRLGADPDIRTMGSGDRVCNLSVATSESWKDKQSGEKKERTEWHRVVVFAQPLITLIESYVKKGDQIQLFGQLENRSWEQDGQKKYTTEIVLRPYKGELILMGSRNNDDLSSQSSAYSNTSPPPAVDELEDEIPF